MLFRSNVTIPKLALILRDARIRPAINEMELHPCFQQEKLFQYCMSQGIQPVGYSPLGSPARPERDRSPEDVVDLEAQEVKSVAAAHGTHPSAVSLKWAVQRGQIPIPFTVTRSHYLSNLRAVCEETLTAGEMELMKKAERNNRLIKGQVFLWPGKRTWQDLWDEDGTISGW